MHASKLYGFGFLVLATACLSFTGSGRQASSPQTGASANHFATEPFDLHTSILGADFAGNDPEAVYDALTALENKLKKDEFETTAHYQQRMREAADATLKGNLKLSSIYAFRLRSRSFLATYDADIQQMTVKVSSSPVVTGSSRDESYSGASFDDSREEVELKSVDRGDQSYTGINGFGATAQVRLWVLDIYDIAFLRVQKNEIINIPEDFSLKVDAKPEAARTLKPNLAVVALVSLDANSSYTAEFTNTSSATIQNPHAQRNTSKLIFCKLVDLWVFDERDGSVLSKFSTSVSQ